MKKRHLILLVAVVFIIILVASMVLSFYITQRFMNQIDRDAGKQLMDNPLYSAHITAKQHNMIMGESWACGHRADNQKEKDACRQMRDDLIEETILENYIYSTALTAEQKSAITEEYTLCDTEAKIWEDWDACRQMRHDLIKEAILENYIADKDNT